jgi:hypothetical protein
MKNKPYRRELRRLHGELVVLQEWDKDRCQYDASHQIGSRPGTPITANRSDTWDPLPQPR